MKYYLKPYLAIILPAILFSACHTDTSTQADIPAPGNISLSPYKVYPYTATGVWGVFYAIRSTGTYNSTVYTSEGAEACILNNNGTGYTPVSGITINNAAGLTGDNNNVYSYNIDSGVYSYHYYSDSVGFNTGVNWAIYYSAGSPDITYADNGTMPFFNYPVIASIVTISSSQPLTINLNASLFSNADSVYVVLPYYAKTQGKVYPVNAGIITVTSTELRGTYSYPYNGNLVIMPYSSKTVKISGKNYLFVKAFRYVQPVYVIN